LHFEDDRDRALYIVARDFTKSESDNPNSAAHGKFLAWLKQVAPNMKHPEILEGRAIRAQVKTLAQGAKGDTVEIPRSPFWDKEPVEGASASHGAPRTEADFARKDRSQLQATLGERAKANWGAYYEQLKQARKVGVRFESPEHRMLFMYGNRESLPQELQDKLLYRMRQMKGYSTHEMSIADIQNRADWTHVHLLEMAHSGHFQPDEPGMFRSTKIGSPLDGTKYMMQMKREADNKQIAPLMAALKNHPKDMAIFRKSFQELNKENAAMFQEPAQWLQYRKALGVLVDSSLKRFTVMGHLF
jgi:hypothetical protein